MLQDDGHLARIAFAQNLRNLAVRMSGAEGDVEMVVARQAVSRHMDQGPPHHAAQRIFDHAIVAQAALARFLGHVTSSPASCCRCCRGYCSLWHPPVGRFCCQVRRSEEHTSELQSLMRISYAVFCLKKKIQQTIMDVLTTAYITTLD